MNHILLIGDPSIGKSNLIMYKELSKCPNCGITFKEFITQERYDFHIRGDCEL